MKRYEKLEKDPVAREERILALWEQMDAFEESLRRTKNGPRYVFYEGPPTANGKPHFGHLMPRVYKDLFPRYKSMQGFYVGRKGGWDTHGLPVELEVEKEIGVNSKPEIESYGVERFVERCKESVWRYKADWEQMIRRMGFWIDLDHAYVTYHDDYIETVWWELKSIFDRGLLYQGHKTLPYCPRCGTGLSSHEVAQGYRTVEDPSVWVKMEVADDADAAFKRTRDVPTYLLTWTTTPWTLPANVALAVAADETYVEVQGEGEHLVVARALAQAVTQTDLTVLREFRGADLVGLRYRPPYDLTQDPAAHRVVPAGFVNMDDGTGIVHIASAFGEDDYHLGQEVGLPFLQPVDLSGRFTDAFPLGRGKFVKDVDALIIADLRARDLLYREEPYEHEYPFCWRCDTPLLYYAMDSWYIRTTDVKQEMIDNNASINWYPKHVGAGRLGDFLANLKDWALSRDRYWGTPLNLWICASCRAVTSVGSRAELVERAVDPELAQRVELHRPYLDALDLRCEACGGKARRVPYVIDTWFDSGSMHTAQWHYPFEHREEFEDSFPADFICEAMEQTRGWFYTLLATSTMIHGSAPYKNCMGTGLGLDENGLKMSKSKGNVLDPWESIGRYGADCIRWYLYASSAPWKSKRLGEAAIQEPLYRFLDTIRNTYDFFALYASIDGYDPAVHRADPAEATVLDQWILSRLEATILETTRALDAYDVTSATAAIEGWVDDLSNWYVRLCRRRFWRGGMSDDKVAAYATLRTALLELAKLVAPFIPFLAEALYQNLRGEEDPESVHFCAYPAGEPQRVDEGLEQEMALARMIAALGHQARNQSQIKVRQPLSRIIVVTSTPSALRSEIREAVLRELNVERMDVVEDATSFYNAVPTPNFRSIGPRLADQAPKLASWIRMQSGDDLRRLLAQGEAIVEIDGQEVRVVPEDVLYESVLPDGFVAVESGGAKVLLDVRLDDDLRRKGLFREVVHRIQLGRKNAGFEVTDRIHLAYEAEAPIRRVIEEHASELASEILATELHAGLRGDAEHSETIHLEEGAMSVELTRTGEDHKES